MDIRLAVEEEIEKILAIYDIARQFMRENGNKNQWINGYPQRQLLLDDIKNNNLYVITENSDIHGVFAFILGDDATYHYIEGGNWPNNNYYGTIHRIGTDGTIHGALTFARDFALKKVSTLRIDTHNDNKVMQHTVEKNGFKRCGIIYVEDGSPRIVFQYN